MTQKSYYRKKRYSHLAGYVFRQVQIKTRKKYDWKKRYSRLAVSWKLEKITPGKKGIVVCHWLEHKTQNTTHIIDTTTNKMSRATLHSSGFAPSLFDSLSGICLLYTHTYVEMSNQLFILFLCEKNRKDTNKDL
jgi:hypothetical protein